MAVKAGTVSRRMTAAGLWPFVNEQDIESGCPYVKYCGMGAQQGATIPIYLPCYYRP
jgi:hypothetical protein